MQRAKNNNQSTDAADGWLAGCCFTDAFSKLLIVCVDVVNASADDCVMCLICIKRCVARTIMEWYRFYLRFDNRAPIQVRIKVSIRDRARVCVCVHCAYVCVRVLTDDDGGWAEEETERVRHQRTQPCGVIWRCRSERVNESVCLFFNFCFGICSCGAFESILIRIFSFAVVTESECTYTVWHSMEWMCFFFPSIFAFSSILSFTKEYPNLHWNGLFSTFLFWNEIDEKHMKFGRHLVRLTQNCNEFGWMSVWMKPKALDKSARAHTVYRRFLLLMISFSLAIKAEAVYVEILFWFHSLFSSFIANAWEKKCLAHTRSLAHSLSPGIMFIGVFYERFVWKGTWWSAHFICL